MNKKQDENKKRKDLSKLEKLCVDTEENFDEDKAMAEIYNILHSSQYKECDVYYSGDIEISEKRFKKIDDIIGENVTDSVDCLLDKLLYNDNDNDNDNKNNEAEKDKKDKYEPDFDNTLIRSLTIISYMGMDYKLS